MNKFSIRKECGIWVVEDLPKKIMLVEIHVEKNKAGRKVASLELPAVPNELSPDEALVAAATLVRASQLARQINYGRRVTKEPQVTCGAKGSFRALGTSNMVKVGPCVKDFGHNLEDGHVDADGHEYGGMTKREALRRRRLGVEA